MQRTELKKQGVVHKCESDGKCDREDQIDEAELLAQFVYLISRLFVHADFSEIHEVLLMAATRLLLLTLSNIAIVEICATASFTFN